MIPPIPPFVTSAARLDIDNDADSGDDEFDFIKQLESMLDGDVEADDFVNQFEKQLEHELLFGTTLNDTLSLGHPSSLFNNDNLNLDELDEDYAISNNHRPKCVCGKCRDGYQLGNIFESC